MSDTMGLSWTGLCMGALALWGVVSGCSKGGSTNAGDEGADAQMGTKADAGKDVRQDVQGDSGEVTSAPINLPQPTGPCPEFTSGDLTFSPDGKPRKVKITMSNAAVTLDGPLIFSWYGTEGTPSLAVQVFSDDEIAAITTLGGIIACPYHDDPASGTYPWYLTYPDGKEDDLRVADEVLACAIQKVGVDTRRIHSVGFSSGGLHTTQMSFRRSNYIASVVVMSGGLNGGLPPDPAPMNRFAAMIFYGGPDDSAAGTSFEALSKYYRDALIARGSFTVVCNHNLTHTPPPDQTMWPFFEAHPYGTQPSPWTHGLPAGQPGYCKL